ncbi:hypothetical protein ACGFYV_36680 [Streptomyces sp. NPDC048297]|uniref:hypothetical protein n=1 Tax=Streptomyces sp. NPDC048297 TaxID=3365531 RepID=UPI0037221E3E
MDTMLTAPEAAVNVCLDPVGMREAEAMRGRAGAHPVSAAYSLAPGRDLATVRWARPADGGAPAFSPAAPREFAERGPVTGPTAHDAVEARRVAGTGAWFGVRPDAVAG